MLTWGELVISDQNKDTNNFGDRWRSVSQNPVTRWSLLKSQPQASSAGSPAHEFLIFSPKRCLTKLLSHIAPLCRVCQNLIRLRCLSMVVLVVMLCPCQWSGLLTCFTNYIIAVVAPQTCEWEPVA